MDESYVAMWLGRDLSPIRRNGILDKNEVAAALSAYLSNAQSLFDDARLLYSAAKISRACALCVLALEELAKVPLLANTFLRHAHGVDEKAWEDYWKGGGSHKTKQEAILNYGQIIKEKMDGDPMFRKRLYRLYFSSDVFANLDRFKQSKLYVDIRADGVYSPSSDDVESSVAFDYLLTFGQERADSFQSWHVTQRRSIEFLEVGLGQRRLGETTSLNVQEVKADVLYQATALSASVVPDYSSFNEFMAEYKKRPSANFLSEALLLLAKEVSMRARSDALQNFQSRSIGLLKLLLSFSKSEVISKGLANKLEEALLAKAN